MANRNRRRNKPRNEKQCDNNTNRTGDCHLCEQLGGCAEYLSEHAPIETDRALGHTPSIWDAVLADNDAPQLD